MSSGNFGDISENSYYKDAAQWALEKGIVSGTADGTFNGRASVTRQELAQMLYNMAGKPEVKGDAMDFADANDVSGWAQNAMQWAVENGILAGDGTNLNPKSDATRAEVAQMIMKFVGLL